jgi:hypothetical protein
LNCGFFERSCTTGSWQSLWFPQLSQDLSLRGGQRLFVQTSIEDCRGPFLHGSFSGFVSSLFAMQLWSLVFSRIIVFSVYFLTSFMVSVQEMPVDNLVHHLMFLHVSLPHLSIFAIHLTQLGVFVEG